MFAYIIMPIYQYKEPGRTEHLHLLNVKMYRHVYRVTKET